MAKRKIKPLWNGTRNWKWRTRIKELRRQLGNGDQYRVTQQILANKLGVDRVTMGRWEQKRNNLTPSRLAQREIERLEKRT